MASEEPSHPWVTDEIEDLCRAVSSLRTGDEVERFLRDLCTLGELEGMAHPWGVGRGGEREAMAHRWEVAKRLDEGLPYVTVAERTGASTTTVTRVAQWLRRG